MRQLLQTLLTIPPKPIPATPIASWWETLLEKLSSVEGAFARAVLGGFYADRIGFAFAAGYQAALSSLFPHPPSTLASLCVTEEKGGHPSAIQTTLQSAGQGFTLHGVKRFATLGAEAKCLFVLATRGEQAGRKDFALVRVEVASANGLRFVSLPETPFTPEIGHASAHFDNTRVSKGEVLPGDGYARYIKPFRTAEDCHVFAAVLGYLVQSARRLGWPKHAVHEVLALLAAFSVVAQEAPHDPSIHLACEGAMQAARQCLTRLAPYWETAPTEESARWTRDLSLLSIAERVREQRVNRAWEDLQARVPLPERTPTS
jgi:hypothetical protein